MMEKEIGRIIHYFSEISVAVIELTSGVLKIGDAVHIHGHTTELFQRIDSMQSEHVPVDAAEKGMQVGLKVDLPVRINDKVSVIKLLEE